MSKIAVGKGDKATVEKSVTRCQEHISGNDETHFSSKENPMAPIFGFAAFMANAKQAQKSYKKHPHSSHSLPYAMNF